MLALALQGGGAHGAFTWGVLDRLLDEPRLAFPVVTGASAGALNGALLVSGYANGGRAGAQAALAGLWEGVGRIGALMAPLQDAQGLAAPFGLSGAGMMQAMMRMWSPAQLNPFNLNPLRDILERLVDVDALRRYRAMRLYVSATDVETGAARIFTGDDLSIDALMASACLPTLYQAVTIDGVPYWDGGYSANPPLGPLLPDAAVDAALDGSAEAATHAAAAAATAFAADALLVQINPERRAGPPVTPSDIVHRVSEITFNASLLAELRRLEALLAGTGRSLTLHRIGLHDEANRTTATSSTSLDEAFHRELRDHGRRAAERWLDGGWKAARASGTVTPKAATTA